MPATQSVLRVSRADFRFEQQLGRFFARVGEFVFGTHSFLALAVKHFLLH